MAWKPPNVDAADPASRELAETAVDAAGERRAAALEPGIVHPAGASDRTHDADPLSIKPTAANIQDRLKRGEAVLVEGQITGADGKPHRQWVAVERYDEKAGTFAVREPGANQTIAWDAKQLGTFSGGKLGGEALAVEQLPPKHASQAEIDALVAAAPAGMRDSAATAVPLVLDEAARAGVTDRKQLAYILASAQHESHLGNAMTEKGNGAGKDGHDHYFDKYDGKLGNTQPHDGEKYKGRGYVQVTGHDNYKTWSDRLGIDMVANPEKMTTPDVAARAMVEGMRDGSFTGKGLGDFATDKRPYYDYEKARGIVNGDRHTVDPGATQNHGQIIAGYAKNYEGALLRAQIKEQIPRMAAAGVTLDDPKSTPAWNGTPQTGVFVKVDDNTYVMPGPRGQYVSFDLQHDLGGVAPREGVPQRVDARGHVADPPAQEQTKAQQR